ncbi:hypothetical protein TorRG33x02_320790 [Trema orientale]|uniref:Uncharacterized protein n=1 Tax=Trema orientale TaxID=63057 RepID=A0A2P5BHS6_TREOI|nr:hypothetical protein TorRG33x02_320790 [Trema orientale]
MGWINGDPKQRQSNRNKPRPHKHYRRRLPSSTHQPFSKWVQVSQYPEAKEGSSNELAPFRDRTVNRPRERYNNGDYVHHRYHDGRNHQRCPLHQVQVGEYVVVVFSGGFRGQGERDLDSGDHFQEALYHGGQVGARAGDEPELFVSPPLF